VLTEQSTLVGAPPSNSSGCFVAAGAAPTRARPHHPMPL
jgi:hypothetical protein